MYFLFVSGHCKVDQTEKGWFIAYIDRDPETIERQKVYKYKKVQLNQEKIPVTKMFMLYKKKYCAQSYLENEVSGSSQQELDEQPSVNW